LVVGLNASRTIVIFIPDNPHGRHANSDHPGPYCHQKACSLLFDIGMSKAPRRPSQRNDLKRWDDEGGAPRSGHPSHEAHHAPKHEAHPALYYFNIKTPRCLIEDPEGEIYPSLQIARKDALAKARNMIAEGDKKGEDRRGWRFEIMDRANQHVLTVTFSEVSKAKVTGQGEGH
jgi:hypothetical protein